MTRPALAAWLAAVALAAAVSSQAAEPTDPDWRALTPAQRTALAPLRGQWADMGPVRRQKWLEVAARLPSMAPDERERIQARMNDWAGLSPSERGQARVQFQEAQRWTPEERQQRWEAYQSLHPQARQVLAERWRLEAAARDPRPTTPIKRNLIEPPPPRVAPALPATPTTVRAAAGVTVQPLNRPPTVPAHVQPGLPKVTATASFVDPVTLLPRRGAQGAAVLPPPEPRVAPDLPVRRK